MDDNGDFVSLEDVRNGLRSGKRIWSEGEGFVKDNKFHATEIEFESLESDELRGSEIEFESEVSSVNASAGTFILEDDVRVNVDPNTDIDDSGDCRSLDEVDRALDNAVRVIAEGEGEELAENQPADVLAVEVRFEQEEAEDESEDDSD